MDQSLRLAGPEFLRHLRPDRGTGRRCASATAASSASAACWPGGWSRRGVRFVEVSHNLNFLNGTGWDIHNEGISSSTC